MTSPLVTTQRKPPVDATHVAQNSAYRTVNRLQQAETGPHGAVADKVAQRDTSCTYEAMYSARPAGVSARPHLSGVTSYNLDPVSMELTCCPLHSEGTASTLHSEGTASTLHSEGTVSSNTPSVNSMHAERDVIALTEESESPNSPKSDLASIKSATPSQTSCKNQTNTPCVQAPSKTSYTTGSTTGSPSHCEAQQQSPQEHTLRDHSSPGVGSANLTNNSQSIGQPLVNVDDSFEVGEEEEEGSECMEVTEVMRTMLDDIRVADSGMDMVPLQEKLPRSPPLEAEWPSMEEVHCKRKESCNDTGMDLAGSSEVPVQASVIVEPSPLIAVDAFSDSTGRHSSAASRVSRDCTSGAGQIHSGKGELSRDLTELSPSHRSILRRKRPFLSDDLGLDEMDDTAEDVAGPNDLRPRSSTPLLGNLPSRLVRATWDCSPVQHYSTLEGLSAETSFQIGEADSSEAREVDVRASVGTGNDDRTDVMQPSANVRRGRSLATGSTNKRRAKSSRKQLWPEHVLNTTTSTQTKLAASTKTWSKTLKAVTVTPLSDPYSFRCSHDSGGELGLPAAPNLPSLPPPPTSPPTCASHPMKKHAELEANSLQTSSIKSVCAIIHIGGGGLPPVRTLLKKGSLRQHRQTKRRGGRNTVSLGRPHHSLVDILCTL